MVTEQNFQNDERLQRFAARSVFARRGGQLARNCSVLTRTGRLCKNPPQPGSTRCLRHGGPDAARRFRERQRAALRSGSVTPKQWERAEANRGRAALQHAWLKDPALPGKTIDLGQNERAFSTSARALGVDVTELYPAIADWLRWRYQRRMIDRPNEAAWHTIVQDALPRQIERADAAMVWLSLGDGGRDRRTRTAKALKAALRAGGLAAAQKVAEAQRIAAAQAAAEAADEAVRRGVPRHASKAATPRVAPPVEPWRSHALRGSKRALPDRPIKQMDKAPPRPAKPIGRPCAAADAAEIATLVDVLRGAGPQVMALFGEVTDASDQLQFLRDLSGYLQAPNDDEAARRWTGWATART